MHFLYSLCHLNSALQVTNFKVYYHQICTVLNMLRLTLGIVLLLVKFFDRPGTLDVLLKRSKSAT